MSKSIKIDKAQAKRLGLRKLKGAGINCRPRGIQYSNRGTAIEFVTDRRGVMR